MQTFSDVSNAMSHSERFCRITCHRCDGKVCWQAIEIRLLSFVQKISRIHGWMIALYGCQNARLFQKQEHVANLQQYSQVLFG